MAYLALGRRRLGVQAAAALFATAASVSAVATSSAPARCTERPSNCQRLDKEKQVLAADVCVIGGGLVGMAVAREAAVRGASVVLVEKEAVLSSAASSGNSGLGHTGYDAPVGSLERTILRRAIRRHPELCACVCLFVRSFVLLLLLPRLQLTTPLPLPSAAQTGRSGSLSTEATGESAVLSSSRGTRSSSQRCRVSSRKTSRPVTRARACSPKTSFASWSHRSRQKRSERSSVHTRRWSSRGSLPLGTKKASYSTERLCFARVRRLASPLSSPKMVAAMMPTTVKTTLAIPRAAACVVGASSCERASRLLSRDHVPLQGARKETSSSRNLCPPRPIPPLPPPPPPLLLLLPFLLCPRPARALPWMPWSL